MSSGDVNSVDMCPRRGERFLARKVVLVTRVRRGACKLRLCVSFFGLFPFSIPTLVLVWKETTGTGKAGAGKWKSVGEVARGWVR